MFKIYCKLLPKASRDNNTVVFCDCFQVIEDMYPDSLVLYRIKAICPGNILSAGELMCDHLVNIIKSKCHRYRYPTYKHLIQILTLLL